MERNEREYWELLAIVEQAKEEMQNVMRETQKIPNEIFKLSTYMFNYSTAPERKYFALANKVRRASHDMDELKKHWKDITQRMEAIQFQLFLAEAHVLTHTKFRDRKRERHSKWQNRHWNY